MKYCIVEIRKCYVGDDYLQNHYNCHLYDSRAEALIYLNDYGAKLLGESDCQVPDIRNRIINERGETYGFLDANGESHYFALVELDEKRKNEFLNQ